ncbi:MAG: SDR family oxidoreductase [Elusimicrobia bacterium]|nr:SDR family oxidoreductase [Elusimicrobiota bacterium]
MKTLAELSRLDGRAALVAGGAGHVGRAACEALIELGARVAVVDRDAAACRRRVAELPEGAAVAVPADLADEASARRAVRESIRRLGGLDVLVHAAAFVGTSKLAGWAAPFARQSSKAFDAAMRVNLTSAFTLVQEAAPALARSGHGSVILFSSIYGRVGPDMSLYAGTAMANPAGYGASKGGLNQLTRHLATTLAPRVRVNAVSPGGIERGQPRAFQARYRARTPLRRMAREEDLKGAVAYLASGLSAYVTGQDLLVDGGWTAW